MNPSLLMYRRDWYASTRITVPSMRAGTGCTGAGGGGGRMMIGGSCGGSTVSGGVGGGAGGGGGGAGWCDVPAPPDPAPIPGRAQRLADEAQGHQDAAARDHRRDIQADSAVVDTSRWHAGLEHNHCG